RVVAAAGDEDAHVVREGVEGEDLAGHIEDESELRVRGYGPAGGVGADEIPLDEIAIGVDLDPGAFARRDDRVGDDRGAVSRAGGRPPDHPARRYLPDEDAAARVDQALGEEAVLARGIGPDEVPLDQVSRGLAAGDRDLETGEGVYIQAADGRV